MQNIIDWALTVGTSLALLFSLFIVVDYWVECFQSWRLARANRQLQAECDRIMGRKP